MSINDIPEEVLSMIFKMMDLKDLTNIFVKVSKKWMNIIAFMIIHPILKTRNRGLAQKFEENGWSCDDANFILVLFENQEKLSKVHDQMMMKASGPLDWTMSSLPSRSRSTQRQWFAKVLLLLQWMNIIAFMIIHPILKTRNRGWCLDFLNTILLSLTIGWV